MWEAPDTLFLYEPYVILISVEFDGNEIVIGIQPQNEHVSLDTNWYPLRQLD